MISGENILCVSSIDWDFIWQGHQQIMASLAAAGNRVLFVENTGVRAPRLRDLPRIRQRIRNWRRGTKGFRQERENLVVYSPIILPFPYSRLARRINRWLLLRALQRWMHAMEFYRPIVWTFLPTPLTLDLIHELDPVLTVYYCIDDLASSSPSARRIGRSEEKLFHRADVVFVTAEKLRERAVQFAKRVHVFPFGVDFERFERVRESPDRTPEDLQQVPKPIVGYVGGLHQWVDQELLAAVAQQLPEVNFVLIGPAQTDVSGLRQCRNVHLFGARSHSELPRYIKGFDVGIVPYRLSEYTDHVYPTKLNEYLAMGVPVVATELPEVRRFNTEYGSLVSVAADAKAFAIAVQGALRDHSPASVRQRIDISRHNSWAERIARMSQLLEVELAIRRSTEARWQEALRRLYRIARRRVFGTVICVVLLYLALFRSSLLWVMAEPLRMVQAPQPADAIVVFAGGVGETGKEGAGGGYQERVKQAVDLYRAHWAPRMIFSSGYTFVFQEAEVMKGLATNNGVPESAILLETKAANTVQNVSYVKRILDKQQWRSILLVSSPYHMRRAVLTFRKIAPGIQVIPTPVPYSQFYVHGRGAHLKHLRAVLHEYVAILYYWSKGWI